MFSCNFRNALNSFRLCDFYYTKYLSPTLVTCALALRILEFFYYYCSVSLHLPSCNSKQATVCKTNVCVCLFCSIFLTTNTKPMRQICTNGLPSSSSSFHRNIYKAVSLKQHSTTVKKHSQFDINTHCCCFTTINHSLCCLS